MQLSMIKILDSYSEMEMKLISSILYVNTKSLKLRRALLHIVQITTDKVFKCLKDIKR